MAFASVPLSPMRPTPLLIAAAVALRISPVGAVPLLRGFGGPDGYGLAEHCVHPSDDGSYAGPHPDARATPVAIDLRAAFPEGLSLFDARVDHFFVNTNGNITFAAPLADPTPAVFPVVGQPMIAPWWADVDTRGGGNPGGNAVCFHVEPGRLVVTWHDVRRSADRDDARDDFQLIVTTSFRCPNVDRVDLEFRYHRCEWTAGADGAHAQVGFDAGNGRNFYALPSSRTAAIGELCQTSNVPGGEAGLHRVSIVGVSDGGGCSGAGTPCVVPGRAGVCADGVTLCRGSFDTYCQPLRRPQAARCNGLDNDCDGRVDDGAALCGEGEVCDRGRCAARCPTGRDCPAGRVCSARETCVDDACESVACPTGQRCHAGACVSLCEGVACPFGQQCRAGGCVDPCDEAFCEGDQVCQNDGRLPGFGQCQYSCTCGGCAVGLVCAPDGRCVTDDCLDVTCPTGSYCDRGSCRDRCALADGATPCPAGEVCVAGQCRRPGAAGLDAGAPRVDAAVAEAGAGEVTATSASEGCDCHAGHARAGRSGVALVACAGLWAMRRRAERSRKSTRHALRS
jgi:hypothetical protein